MDQPASPLPTFFVIGAPKCGTTSVHHYLSQHPAVSMSAVKEPFIFAAEDWRSRLIEYAHLLDPSAAVRGESSTVYSQYPHFGDVPARIAEAVPDAAFLYLVRDPVDRALAHYRQRLADGKESRPPGEALADHASPDSTYLSASRYATQLRVYLRRFPEHRFLVLDQDELREQRALALGKVFAFLGVAELPSAGLEEARLNTRDDQRIATAAGRRLGDSRLLKLGRRIPLPEPLRRRARTAISRPVPAVALPSGLRRDIVESLREEVRWLREFSGQAFPGWSV